MVLLLWTGDGKPTALSRIVQLNAVYTMHSKMVSLIRSY